MTMAATADLVLDGVTRRYGAVTALDGVSFTAPANAYVTLLGPSGAGKTALLRLIAGFEQLHAGWITLGERRLDNVPAHQRGIGFVFQNFALFPHLSVRDNIAFGLRHRGQDAILDPVDLRARVAGMIELVGLAGLEDRSVDRISGGQRQRVALARTLVTEPRLVLLDEPLGALDANLRERMRDELRRIRARLGVTFLHVTGSETEALAMGDVMVVLDRGRVAQVDAPATVYGQPASPRVAGFLNCYNVFHGAIRRRCFHHGRISIPVATRRSSSGG